MRYVLPLLLATLGVHPVSAQTPVPEIAFDSAPNPLSLPDDIYLGEAAGVATNSKGDIFVFTRTGHPTVSLGTSRTFAHGGSRLFEFDKTGKFVREIGANSYGFMVAQQVRIDPQDNIWVVDQMTNYVIKFDPQGRVAMLLGRKAEAVTVPAPPQRTQAIAGGAPGAGEQTDLFERPTDVAWDAAGDIYVADGLGNARVAKFNKNGVFIKSWGAKGSEPGNFGTARSIAVDARGNVYVGDGGNRRIEVFDGDGNFKTQYTNVGNPQALCITPGPNQVLFVSNSNPPNDIDTAGEIYKMRLDGSVIGKFGRAGKLPKEFGTVNAIDCRSENALYVGEIGNMRVQKLTLH
ncbi:MAG TPA: peptidyl-alpha-hydroxyglycine alpha-amidating lyase family protein [Xanthobacteraceae bacterium]|jgi:DNA-binding beta-propeller fold protein YncE|nr:peptidyl-alpha-hydroxyglycine alpha-amidating lyase family protein [Xanthobacteraceae bacterium]